MPSAGPGGRGRGSFCGLTLLLRSSSLAPASPRLSSPRHRRARVRSQLGRFVRVCETSASRAQHQQTGIVRTKIGRTDDPAKPNVRSPAGYAAVRSSSLGSVIYDICGI